MKAILVYLTLCIALTTVAVDSLFCDPKAHKYYHEQYHEQYGDCLDCEPCHPGEEPMNIKEWSASLPQEVFTPYGPTQCPRCVKCRPHHFNDKGGYQCTRCSNCTLHNKHEVKPCTTTSNAECDGILRQQRSENNTGYSEKSIPTPVSQHNESNVIIVLLVIAIVLSAGCLFYTVYNRKKPNERSRDVERNVEGQSDSGTAQSSNCTETTYAFENNGKSMYIKGITTDGEYLEQTFLKTTSNETHSNDRNEQDSIYLKATTRDLAFPKMSGKVITTPQSAIHNILSASAKAVTPDSEKSRQSRKSPVFRPRMISRQMSSPFPMPSDDENTPLMRNKKPNKRKRRHSEYCSHKNFVSPAAESKKLDSTPAMNPNCRLGSRDEPAVRRRCFSDSYIDLEQDTLDCEFLSHDDHSLNQDGAVALRPMEGLPLVQLPLNGKQLRMLARVLVENSNFKNFARVLGMSDGVLYEIEHDHRPDGIAEVAHQVIQGLVKQKSCLYKNDVILALKECELFYLIEQIQI